VSAINDADENYIGAFGKLRMVFNQGTEPPPIDRLKIINEDAAVRIAHLQRCDFQDLTIDVERIVDDASERLFGCHRHRSGIKSRLTQLGTKKKRSNNGALQQMISLDAVPRLQPQQFVRPKTMKEQVGRGTASAVSGHARFATVGIEDAHAKVCVRGVRAHGDGDAVSAGAVMTIADAAGESSEIRDRGELLIFENQIVVSEALKFCESHS